VAIFGGIHGNETVGVLAVQELMDNLEVQRGTVYLAFGNVPAIEAGVRLTGKNLNRCFVPGNEGDSYEDARARELMAVLDRCDGLLDLHAFNEDTGEPFIICEDNSLEIALKLEPPIISTNWSEAEPGATDGYMYQQGKVGICVECGPSARAEEYLPVALKSARQFLQAMGLIDDVVEFATGPKRIVRAERAVVRAEGDFWLDESLRSFQKLAPGMVFGAQGGKEFVAREGEYIIFPRPKAKVGAEAFVIGRESPLGQVPQGSRQF
jgi:succinylglutamate desuccinylase